MHPGILCDRCRPRISELTAAELRIRSKEYSDGAATARMAGVAQSLRRLADMYGRLAEAKEAADLDQCEDSNAADGGECTTAKISCTLTLPNGVASKWHRRLLT